MRAKKGFVSIIFISLFFITLAVVVGVVLSTKPVQKQPQASKKATLPKESEGEKLTPTPIPFVELTIDHQRQRNYQSRMIEKRVLSENSQYTSYLASYDSDGLKINGLLTVPKGNEPAKGWPAIVFVHGYIPPTLYQTTSNYSSYVDYFARNGFVVYKIDLRGHADSEGEPGGAYYSSDYIIDTLNAYSFLQASEFVDKDSVGLWGHSMAGNVVFRAMVVKKDIPAVVIWAGAVYTYEDMQKYRIDDNSYRPPEKDSKRKRDREKLREIHGSFDKDSKFWQMVVPTNYLDGVKGSLQVHHAVNDPVVNIGYSRDLMEILASTDIEHELFEYPSGGHNITGSSFSQAMQRSVEFFRDNL